MNFRKFTWDVIDSNSFLIQENNDGILIDAVESDELYTTISQLQYLTIILTHSHFDHIIGLNKIRELKPNSKVISTKLCSEHVGNIHKNMSAVAQVFMSFYENGKKKDIYVAPVVCKPSDEIFENEMNFSWHNHKINIFAVFGHSNDGLVAVIDDKYLFSGDTLLNIPTVTRFPGGNTKLFFENDIPKLKNMSVEKVFPGHGEAGNLIDMLLINKKG